MEKLQPHPHVMEGDGKEMQWVSKLEFKNWGETVTNTPSDTFVARTEVGLRNLVVWASEKKKKIRVAGYRHTVSLAEWLKRTNTHTFCKSSGRKSYRSSYLNANLTRFK